VTFDGILNLLQVGGPTVVTVFMWMWTNRDIKDINNKMTTLQKDVGTCIVEDKNIRQDLSHTCERVSKLEGRLNGGGKLNATSN
jgi:hypothetical protein